MPTAQATKKARKTEPHRSPDDLLELDSKGDLVLKVGAKAGFWMRISSKHLTTISKVFETLLGPQFAEGQRDHDISNPLCLPDDDPRAMELLCKLAHHKVTDTSEIGAKDLSGLVVICDKYDCVAAFSLVFHVLLGKWVEDSEDLSWTDHSMTSSGITLFEALCIAYVTNDAASFGQVSRLLFLRLPDPEPRVKVTGSLKPLMALMPKGFLRKVADARDDALERQSKPLYDPLRRFDLVRQTARGNPLKSGDHCTLSLKRTALYTLELTCHDLLPFGKVYWFSKHYSKEMDLIGSRLQTLIQAVPTCTGDCPDCRFDWAKAVRHAVSGAKLHLRSLCLMRVKEDDFDTEPCECGPCGT